MNVRKIVKTTISATVLVAAFVFFKIYFVGLLSRFLNFITKSEGYFEILTERLFPAEYIGSYYPSLFYICVVIILAACTLDAIFNHKYALKVFSSFKQPLIIAALLIIALSVQKLNILQLWAIFYFFLLICLHSAFKRMLLLTDTAGEYAELKLFKQFVLTIIETIKDAFSTGITGFDNPVDETAKLSASGIILLLETTVFVSFVVFMAKYWRLIFLAHIAEI